MLIMGPIIQSTKRICLSLLLLGFCGQWGCRDPNAQISSVVVEVEHAGAGNDISSLTTPELTQWFTHQPAPFVHKINDECAPLRAKAPAAWHMRTAEGRVCDAVLQVAPLTFTPYEADHTRY